MVRGMYPKRAAPPAIPEYATVLSDDLRDFSLRLTTDIIDRIVVDRWVEAVPRGILRPADMVGRVKIMSKSASSSVHAHITETKVY